MTALYRPSLGTALCRVSLAALAAGCLAVTVARLADTPTPLGLPAGDDPEVERGRRLDEQLRAVCRRIEGKNRLAQEVAAGRLGLVEAAARYRDLDRDGPFDKEVFRSAYPGGSDDERYCREVIVFVREVLREPPCGDVSDPAVVGRLEAELHDRLERGDLRLPVAPAGGGPGARSDGAPVRVGEKFLAAPEGGAGRDRGDQTVYAGGRGGK
jgi:hypothetical protein